MSRGDTPFAGIKGHHAFGLVEPGNGLVKSALQQQVDRDQEVKICGQNFPKPPHRRET